MAIHDIHEACVFSGDIGHGSQTVDVQPRNQFIDVRFSVRNPVLPMRKDDPLNAAGMQRTAGMQFQLWFVHPPVISWLINPHNYSYKYHKP